MQFNEILNSFKRYLSRKHKDITLLDAHSFLWIYGYKFEKLKKQASIKRNIKLPVQKTEISIPVLQTYQPKTIIDIENYIEVQNEIDYFEQYKMLKKIGDLAENIVLESEIEFLKNISPALAAKVRSVANDPNLGFDILSFETDGTQKQIEVKAISTNKNIKSFIITRNEIIKSKVYANYYLYCVTNLNIPTPTIIRIKNPDFENNTIFIKEPLTYKISFE